jgi:hypothetical protein
MAAYEMGDDSWSVGCRAYAFGKQRLKRAATSRVHEWLSVMDDSHHFVFLIEKVPIRFYRGFAEEPTVRTLRRHEAESQQLGLALGIDEADGLVFRFAIETGMTGNVERVVFLALRGDEGYAECAWQVRLEMPAQQNKSGVQLRLIEDDGYSGPEKFQPPTSPMVHSTQPRRVKAR